MSLGKLVIVSGPSGVGKDTVIDAWLAEDPSVERVITVTTRAPRPKEQDGVDYYFKTVPEFLCMKEANAFLECKSVYGNWYGSPVQQVDEGLAHGKNLILKIDVQGAEAVIQARPEALSIFILPPSKEELESRLRARLTDDEPQILRRLKEADEEIEKASMYKFQVVNDEVDKTVARMKEIVRG